MSNSYKNMKLKLLGRKNAISYYKIFKEKPLTPKYIYAKVNESNMQSKKLCICWANTYNKKTTECTVHTSRLQFL